MNPRLRLLKEDGRAKWSFLGLIRDRQPDQPFNALMIVAVNQRATPIFKAWWDACFPTATAMSLDDDIVDVSGYPTGYMLNRWAEIS
jgi:hypothetical protein